MASYMWVRVSLFVYVDVYLPVLFKDGVLVFAPVFQGAPGTMYVC